VAPKGDNSHFFLGDVQDRCIQWQGGYALERLEPAAGNSEITVGRLVEHVLRGHEFVIRPLGRL